MKQLVQYATDGKICLVEVPVPKPKPRQLLVRTLASAVSTGTERGNLDFARASIVEKARRRPDLVAKVVSRSLQEGPLTAYREARSRLEEPFPLGYSSAGIVEAVGKGVSAFRPGDLVACSGAKAATHAEFVVVPETMCSPVPGGVHPEDAAFSALAAVVIHGMRRGGVEIGSRVAIVGLGLLGLLGVQLAKASGTTVIAADVSRDRCDFAVTLGADLTVVPDEQGSAEAVRAYCGPTGGVDVALVTATSPTNAPFVWAADIARERGHVVVIGNFPPDLPRRYGYDKELTVEFSRAWGPGTYDPGFQQRGLSEGYPPSLVRWTAPRNMQTYLELVAAGSVSARRLVTHRFPIDRAEDAYRILSDPQERPLGVVISYPASIPKRSSPAGADGSGRESPAGADGSGRESPASEEGSRRESAKTVPVPESRPEEKLAGRVEHETLPEGRLQPEPDRRVPRESSVLRVGILGAGNHIASTLMRVMASVPRLEVTAIASASGLRAADIASRYSIPRVAAEPEELFAMEGVDAVVVATRHDTHAYFALEAIKAGKHVWVEKPLALDVADIDRIQGLALRNKRVAMVGFNRRFSPFTAAVLEHLNGHGPFYIWIRANPGALEAGHWVLDPREGGGRLVSEGCHFFDLACALAKSSPVAVSASITTPRGEDRRQGFQALLEFEDGSTASITYAGSGPRSFGRERFEIIGTDRAAGVVDFRTLYRSGMFRAFPRIGLVADKGFRRTAEFFATACLAADYDNPILEEMFVSSRLTLTALAAAASGNRLRVGADGSTPVTNLQGTL